ncbi:hypothetical protein CVT24_006228 [Panaeolus cyanescens]|uniref:Heat shock 70 kDa protein 12A n=1 Tax=Panaeolus cyanescens TaxID=181874 RepID=A0A409YEF9_9AGAR|nr:hypothetical protein CVT24_006228 [Panaeolus cyanescens]
MASPAVGSAPYQGPSRRLVIAFDVGTTYSGISYSILDPGQTPEIKGVTKFPAQDHVHGSSKIPTVLYYDKSGKVQAIGAETLSEGIFERATDGGWHKVEWFKLHLRPQSTIAQKLSKTVPPLPPNKLPVDIFSDFLRYLLECTKNYIRDSHANGPQLWSSLSGDCHYVLSHPNGWEGIQQTQIRKAAVMGGLVPDTDKGASRISFVTEGEASLHFAIRHGLPTKATQENEGVVIVDAGGGTIDISAYARTSNAIRQTFDEIAQPQCHLHGSVFVNMLARVFLEEFLHDSAFLDDLDHIMTCFDKTTKLRFRNTEEPCFIKFGSTRDNDEDYNIRYGQLKLKGTDVATFFEPSIQCIIDAVKEQRDSAHGNFSHVVLVGGFAASDWLYNVVSSELKKSGFSVVRPDHHVSKAVSDGAISFYIDHFVNTRVSKITYGSRGSIDYNPNNPEHVERESKSFVAVSGEKRINDVFYVILATNTQVPETNEIRRNHFWEFTSFDELKRSKTYLHGFRGSVKDAAWMDVDADKYFELCTIVTDLSHMAHSSSIQKKYDTDGKLFYRLHYDVIMLFGGTEIKAQVAWKEDGVERRSDAKILYTSNLPINMHNVPAPVKAPVKPAKTLSSQGGRASVPLFSMSYQDGAGSRSSAGDRNSSYVSGRASPPNGSARKNANLEALFSKPSGKRKF